MTVRSRGGVLFGPLLIWFRCFASARFTRARRLDPPARRPSPAYAPCPCACLSSTCSAQKHTLVAFNCEFLIPQRPVFARGRYSFSQASSPLVSSLCVRLLFGMRLFRACADQVLSFCCCLVRCAIGLGLGWTLLASRPARSSVHPCAPRLRCRPHPRHVHHPTWSTYWARLVTGAASCCAYRFNLCLVLASPTVSLPMPALLPNDLSSRASYHWGYLCLARYLPCARPCAHSSLPRASAWSLFSSDPCLLQSAALLSSRWYHLVL